VILSTELVATDADELGLVRPRIAAGVPDAPDLGEAGARQDLRVVRDVDMLDEASL